MNIKNILGKRIKELRKSKGLSQEKLAEMIDLSQNSLSNIECGINFLTSETLEKLLCAFGVSLTEFFQIEHLKEKKILISDIVELLKKHPEKIPEIYKIVKILVNQDG